MAKIQEKHEATFLRKKGKSLKEIAYQLNVSKSTVSNWCRDIVLTPKQTENLERKRKEAGHRGSVIAAEKKRKLRLKEERILRKEGLKEIGRVSKRDLFIAGVATYWSEGYTYTGGDQVGFTNSDPKLVLFMLKWFREVCKVLDDRLSLSIRVNWIHKTRVKEMERYWSKLTGIPLSQFNKTVLIKSKPKKIYPNSDNYYGTLRIVVRRCTQLRRKINGWIEGLTKG